MPAYFFAASWPYDRANPTEALASTSESVVLVPVTEQTYPDSFKALRYIVFYSLVALYTTLTFGLISESNVN